MTNSSFLWLIPFFPLLSSLGIRLLGKKLFSRAAVHFLACSSVFLSFLLSLIGFLELTSLEETQRVLSQNLFPWIRVGSLEVMMGFTFDSLSSILALVVSGVGFLIHIYSTGYMAHEEDFERYFSFLNLFMGMMLILVLANNLFLMFVGWEGVGLCSYLLIGFWFKEKANADAGKKAFIVNRIGDFGFLIGIFSLLLTLGIQENLWSVSFQDLKLHVLVFQKEVLFGFSVATFATLMLFMGATGKSAQIPLYVWLPDAMAGPTPVSALIHAATMVTAGVYMIARLSFLFELSPTTLQSVAWIGGGTAFLGATLGLVQNDIKKVLAYSTISQLGFMFLACGVGAYAGGIFHLMTHAFFKGLLFLGAGSVIHALAHEQDIRKMGGLYSKIPITFWTFLVGTLAISGIPPFAGFFSKDEILWQTWNQNPWLWGLGVFTAFLTAFYMTRLLILTFLGKSRTPSHLQKHIHEAPPSMLIPLILLASLSLIGGWVWFPSFVYDWQWLSHWLSPSLSSHASLHGKETYEIICTSISLLMAFAGIGTAFLFYVLVPKLPLFLAEKLSFFYSLFIHKYWVDEFYQSTFVFGMTKMSQSLSWFDHVVVDGLVHALAKFLHFLVRWDGWLDRNVVDGLVNWVGDQTQNIGHHLRKLQTGQIQTYLAVLTFGLIFLGLIWMWM